MNFERNTEKVVLDPSAIALFSDGPAFSAPSILIDGKNAKLGIGTTPEKELDVLGDVSFSGKIYQNGEELKIDDQSVRAAGAVMTTGQQLQIDGIKEFTQTIRGSITGNAASVTDGVYMSDAQEITGQKTFISNIVAVGGIDASYIRVSGTPDSHIVSSVTGNVTGNVTGDLFGPSNGTHTGAVFGDITGSHLSGDLNSGLGTITQLHATTINATGIVTAVSFKGPLHSAGISTAIILKSDNVDATGIITAASGFVGNITGDVTGKVTGDLYSVGFSTASNLDSVRIVATDQIDCDGVNSTGIVTATEFIGEFLGAAKKVTVEVENTDTTNYLMFVNDVSGISTAKVTTALRYDAQNSTLHATEFAGSGLSLTDIPGSSITGSLNATTVTLTATSSTNASHYLTFTDSATGDEVVRTDTDLTYNPSTNTLTAATFAGDATGLTGVPSISVAAITAAGNVVPSAHSTYNLGSNSVRWNNIYTMDMHFSNKGSQNDVDGTWGDWTLQEGDENIFMKNNRTGKKYKINLTEV